VETPDFQVRGSKQAEPAFGRAKHDCRSPRNIGRCRRYRTSDVKRSAASRRSFANDLQATLRRFVSVRETGSADSAV
jgi:hypothetical protein